MRVECQRVGSLNAPVARGQRRIEHAEGAVGPVDVEPEPLGGGDFCERVERVDRAGVHGSRRAHEQRRRRAGRAVGRDRGAQRVRVETPAAQRHRPDGVAPEPEQLERARHAAVRLGGHVGNEARAVPGPAPAHVVARGGGGAAARAGQADDRRRGRPAGEEPGARRVRVPDELCEPAHGRALEVNVGVVARHHARVHRGGRQRRQHAGQRRWGVDPAEEGRMPVAHCVRQHVARHGPRQRLEPGRAVRQRQLEQRRAQIVRQWLPYRPSRERLEVVGHRVDQRVPGTPELVQIAGAEPARGGFAHSGSIGTSRPPPGDANRPRSGQSLQRDLPEREPGCDGPTILDVATVRNARLAYRILIREVSG